MRIVVATGPNRGDSSRTAARAFADQLGTRVVEFPGDCGGFAVHLEKFSLLLDQVLTQSA